MGEGQASQTVSCRKEVKAMLDLASLLFGFTGGMVVAAIVFMGIRTFIRSFWSQISGRDSHASDMNLAPFQPGLETFVPPVKEGEELKFYQKHGCKCKYTDRERYCRVQKPA
jgi:hypothetical protein